MYRKQYTMEPLENLNSNICEVLCLWYDIKWTMYVWIAQPHKVILKSYCRIACIACTHLDRRVWGSWIFSTTVAFSSQRDILGLAAARIEVRALREQIIPALAIERVCCSITSWRMARVLSDILSNSSMQQIPLSLRTRAPLCECDGARVWMCECAWGWGCECECMFAVLEFRDYCIYQTFIAQF